MLSDKELHRSLQVAAGQGVAGIRFGIVGVGGWVMPKWFS